MIILYTHYEDLAAAEILQKQFGGTLVKRPFGSGPYITSEDIIIIGGQETNDTYTYYMNLDALRFIGPEDAGWGFVQTAISGSQHIYAVAGWYRIDTITAAMWLLENGFPTQQMKVGPAKAITIYQYYPTPEEYQQVYYNRNELFNLANSHLPNADYRIVWWYFDGKNFEVVAFHNNPLVIAAAIAWAAKVLIGAIIALIVYMAYRIVDAVTSDAKEISEGEVNIINAKIKAANNLIDHGVDPLAAWDAVNGAADGYYEGLKKSGISEILTKVMYVALIGAGIYVAVAVGVPLLKQMTEKKSKGGK